MAGRKLAVNTTTLDDDGRMVTFPAGTVVSAGVAEGITNPKAWGSAETDDDGAFPEGEGIDLDGASTKKDIVAKLGSDQS